MPDPQPIARVPILQLLSTQLQNSDDDEQSIEDIK